MRRFWTAVVLCLALFGLTGQASAAVARAHHNNHIPARAARHAAFASPRQYEAPTNVCRLRWGSERPEELAQDRGYQEYIGYEEC
jgi:hypothetical protein